MIKKILLIACGMLVFAGCTPEPYIYDDFATCITDSGAKMYGTEWCPYCKDQKEAFGSSFRNIDYVNCEIKSAECKNADITGYPTWIFGDGEKLSGKQSMSVLADKTGCDLPTNE